MSRPKPWDIANILGGLAEIYDESPARKAVWEDEREEVGHAIDLVGKRIGPRYGDARALGVGGLGIVLLVRDRLLGGQKCAVKLPRPKQGSQDLFAEMIGKEIERLSEVRHSGVVRIHASGQEGDEHPIPFYIMDFIDGAGSAAYMVETRGRNLTEVIRRTADAIDALHTADLVHCDIKPDNVMIDSRGRPVITDLGTTKLFRPEDDSETKIGVTGSYASKDLTSFLTAISDSDPDNFSGSIARSRIRKEWDLVCFGRTILAWLGYDLASGDPSQLTFEIEPYERKYLLLLAARMLGSQDGYRWLEEQINLSPKVIDELAISDIKEVMEAIEKLSGRWSLAKQVPELDPHTPHRIQIGPQRAAAVTPRVRALLEHPLVRRLGSITQLGIVSQVYPTATHSRLEHSLGTYANVCRLLGSLYHDPYSPFFRQVMSAEDLSAILALSILHDTGQFPLAHDLEEVDSQLFDHKRLTRAVIQGGRNPKTAGFQRVVLPSIEQQITHWGLDARRLTELLDVRLDRPAAAVKDRILHSVIDGAIDGDKLDYLARDASRLGVPYGLSVDYERIANGVTSIVARNPSGNSIACIGVHEKSRVAAESLAKSRSEMYSQVYWQHTVRAMKAMLGRAVAQLVVHLEDDENARNQFVSEFENYVMSLPGTLAPGVPQLALSEGSREEPEPAPTVSALTADEPGGLAATDAAVLTYLERYMVGARVRDHELLRAIRARSLFKRLHVWSLSDGDEMGAVLANGWDELNTRQKLAVYERLEAEIAKRVGVAADKNPETVALTETSVRGVRMRMEARSPLILIDLPNSKPESEIPLYYVLETERRALRRDGSAVGKAKPSVTWEQYGGRLREHAGKLRIFCHESAADPIEAAIDRDTFLQLFDDARSAVKTA